MANDTIGTIACPLKQGCIGEVRRQSNGTLYWYCDHGKITPNREAGQEFIEDNAIKAAEITEPPKDPPRPTTQPRPARR